MNYYVETIKRTIEYIEKNICEKLTLSALSKQFGISDYHFNRMFKTVTGITLKQYILGRKLSKSMKMLEKNTNRVTDIAFDLGFEYPEVYSRAFKRQFGVSPNQYRTTHKTMNNIVEKATIVERDLINYEGVLTLNGSCKYIEPSVLWGISIEVNLTEPSFNTELKQKTEHFIMESQDIQSMVQNQFYTVVNCHGEVDQGYTVFCGRKSIDRIITENYVKRPIPEGWYVSFQYYGDMYDIRESFTDELYRWIMLKEAELNPNGIGMINIYNNNYPDNNNIEFLIPIKRPV